MNQLFKILYHFLLKSLGIRSSGNINKTKNFQNGQKNLVALSEYGDKTDTIIENVNEAQIVSIMQNKDWNQFHAVYIERNIGEMVGVIGLLQDDGITPPGLTSTWDEGGKMMVMKNDPKSVNELTHILIVYLKNDEDLKSKYE